MQTLMLSGPQRVFCEGIVRGLSATEAYGGAYARSTPESARKSGSRLLGRPEIQAEIQTLRDKADALAGSAVMTLAERRAFLAAIIRTPVSQITADSPLAQEMKADGKTTSIKMPCKLRAIELDAKLAGEVGAGSVRGGRSSITEDEDEEPDETQAALMQLQGVMHQGE